jgi:hypothetical protein
VTRRRRGTDALRNHKGPDSGPLRHGGPTQTPASTGGGRALDPSTRQGSNVGSRSNTPNSDREGLVDEAVALFSRRYGRPVTRLEAGQAMDRLTAFFTLLAVWESQNRSELAEDNRAA